MGKLTTAICAACVICAGLPAAAEPPALKNAFGKPTPPAFPTTPFFSRLLLTNGAPVSAGPIKGTLGVTNLTFSNFNNTAVKVFVFLPVFVSGGVCGSPVIGGGSPGGYFMIGANQTLTIPYPTPQVYTGLPSCLAANITSGGSSQVELYVTGYSE